MKTNNLHRSSIFLSALLAAALLSSMLASCGSTSATPGETSAASTTASGETQADVSESESTTESARPALDVPDADYEGYEFRVLGYTQQDTGTWAQYLDFGWTTDKAGELINDAIYTRNLSVEEKYDIKISTIENSSPASVIRKSITAGADDFDICEPYIEEAFSLAQDGLFVNIYDVPYLSLDQSWWDDAIQRDLALEGKLYSITGDISLYDEELNYGIYFNKTVAQKYNIDDCYQLVRDNKWTLDKMTELGHIVTQDINGDGVMGDEDSWGVLTDSGTAAVWFFTFGGQMSQTDANGTPSIVMGSEHNQAIADSLYTLFNDKQLVRNASETKNTWDGLNTILIDDRALFRPGSIYDVPLYREMVSDFGILPYPKFDENQEQFYHPIATFVCPGISVPITSTDLDRTGMILETLAYNSNDTVTKAYYEINLYTKLARDDESGEMLDIIFSTKRYDLAMAFGWGGLKTVLVNSTKSGNFASLYAAAESKAQADMEKTIEIFK